MSGTLFLIGEIVVFMVAATAIGFIVGRMTRRRSPANMNVGEITALRERSSLLEREVDELTAGLTEARAAVSRAGDGGELQSRAAMAEREAEGLERRLREASERIAALTSERDEWMALAEAGAAEVVGTPEATERVEALSPADLEELETLRAEVEKRRAEIARLEQVAHEAARLESELTARNNRIGDLEAALEANVANQATHAEGDAASIGVSMGAGNYADSRLEFEAWDPTDD
jgi:chromosome segregation ATPase